MTRSNTITITVAGQSPPPPTTYSINIYASVGGSVTNAGSQSQTSQFSVSSTATANSGYIFIGWYLNGTQISTAASVTVTVTGQNWSLEGLFASQKIS